MNERANERIHIHSSIVRDGDSGVRYMGRNNGKLKNISKYKPNTNEKLFNSQQKKKRKKKTHQMHIQTVTARI